MGTQVGYEKVFNEAVANARTTDNDGGQILINIPWPEHPLFGSDHAKWTAKLAERILQSVFEQQGRGAPTEQELNIIRGAAMFHDLGRTLKADQDWQRPEPGHGVRSADIARSVMLMDDVWRFRQNAHDQICKIIAAHSMPIIGGRDDGKRPTDPFAIALWDAECLESARFDPNTEAGLRITRERFNQTQSAWARLPEHRQRWRNERWRRAKG